MPKYMGGGPVGRTRSVVGVVLKCFAMAGTAREVKGMTRGSSGDNLQHCEERGERRGGSRSRSRSSSNSSSSRSGISVAAAAAAAGGGRG